MIKGNSNRTITIKRNVAFIIGIIMISYKVPDTIILTSRSNVWNITIRSLQRINITTRFYFSKQR